MPNIFWSKILYFHINYLKNNHDIRVRDNENTFLFLTLISLYSYSIILSSRARNLRDSIPIVWGSSTLSSIWLVRTDGIDSPNTENICSLTKIQQTSCHIKMRRAYISTVLKKNHKFCTIVYCVPSEIKLISMRLVLNLSQRGET